MVKSAYESACDRGRRPLVAARRGAFVVQPGNDRRSSVGGGGGHDHDADRHRRHHSGRAAALRRGSYRGITLCGPTGLFFLVRKRFRFRGRRHGALRATVHLPRRKRVAGPWGAAADDAGAGNYRFIVESRRDEPRRHGHRGQRDGTRGHHGLPDVGLCGSHLGGGAHLAPRGLRGCRHAWNVRDADPAVDQRVDFPRRVGV